MLQADPTSPSVATLKQLFALSGNRCAFPKCRTALVVGRTLVGEVCHIKGARPGSARYDPDQPAAERHGFENLVLMCGTHHTVIDDDEISYSVDRLKNLKAVHEEHSSELNEDDHAAFALAIDQSVTVVGQSGGIAAHTINAETIHVHSAPRSRIAEEKTTHAIEILWQIMMSLKAEFSAVTFVDAILTSDELQQGFLDGSTRQPFDTLLSYRLIETISQKFEKAGGAQAETCRPFVTQRLYGIFFATQAVICRSGVLVHLSWKERRYRAWRNDSGIAAHLRSILPEDQVLSLLAPKSFGLGTAVAALEEAFLIETEQLRAGLRAG